MRTHKSRKYIKDQHERQLLSNAGEWHADAAAGVFRRYLRPGVEVETVPMCSWEGQRLLVMLSDKQLEVAARRLLQGIGLP